jgi:FtsP/CotA-like multicopper oxidase with cupredoxin domain
MSGTLSPSWTVNGLVQGALCAPANEWQHWRVLLADRSGTEKTVAVGANCQAALLARDGVWRTTAPKVLTANSINLTGASRADLAVRCTNDSVITVNGATVANVFVNGAGNTAVGPYSQGSTGTIWAALRPDYLRDLRGVTTANLNVADVRMGARTLNGRAFNHDVPTFTFPATKVQQWSVSGNTQHPFHLHVYHFQAQNCSGSFENGEYYDTLTSSCSVRFDLNAATSSVYEGRTIMHCHILEHEDQGAMGWLDTVGGLPPPSFPADSGASPPFSVHYALP